MKIVIIPPDNRIGVDGVFRTVSMDMPHINAVRFDGETANVEHREHNGEWLDPETLTNEEFLERFGPVVAAWHDAPDDAPFQGLGRTAPDDDKDAKIAELEAKLNGLIKALDVEG